MDAGRGRAYVGHGNGHLDLSGCCGWRYPDACPLKPDKRTIPFPRDCWTGEGAESDVSVTRNYGRERVKLPVESFEGARGVPGPIAKKPAQVVAANQISNPN